MYATGCRAPSSATDRSMSSRRRRNHYTLPTIEVAGDLRHAKDAKKKKKKVGRIERGRSRRLDRYLNARPGPELPGAATMTHSSRSGSQRRSHIAGRCYQGRGPLGPGGQMRDGVRPWRQLEQSSGCRRHASSRCGATRRGSANVLTAFRSGPVSVSQASRRVGTMPSHSSTTSRSPSRSRLSISRAAWPAASSIVATRSTNGTLPSRAKSACNPPH